jgi:coproporphyrinogen III oxidase
LPFDSVLVRRGSLNDLKFRMCGEDLIMHAADPMAPRAHFPIRHGEQIFAERRTERLKYLLRCIERDTAHQ